MDARTLALGLLAALSFGLSDQASAAEQYGYRMDILVDGRPLTEYHARGKTYIEAWEGREYTIRLTNPTSRRVAVALSVDGLNTIDARHTSAEAAAKWVLAPWETVEIRGWQTSPTTSRAFYFTTETGSYGAWLGDTDNLGIVSAAFFPEELPPPAPWYMEGDAYSRRDEARKGRAAPEAQAERSAPAGSASGAGRASADALAKAAPSAPLDDDMAATGIGREQWNGVQEVWMELEDSPAAVVSVRYEYREELARLGIVPRPQPVRPLDRRERASGFAPDPWRSGW